VNPDRFGLAAAQEEETEAVSFTHSEADDDIVYPETPSVIRPIRPVLPPAPRQEESMTRLDVDNLLVLKSNVCCMYTKSDWLVLHVHICSYSGSCISLIQSCKFVFKKYI